jgi:hypothetical protein
VTRISLVADRAAPLTYEVQADTRYDRGQGKPVRPVDMHLRRRSGNEIEDGPSQPGTANGLACGYQIAPHSQSLEARPELR